MKNEECHEIVLIICANEALKLEAQEVVCYAKHMMMTYLVYNMNTSEKNEKFLVDSHCFCLMLCQQIETK